MKGVLALLLLGPLLAMPTATAIPSRCEGTAASTQLTDHAWEDGAIHLWLENDEWKGDVRVCIYQGGIRYDRPFSIPANGVLDHTVPAPVGAYRVDYVIGSDRATATVVYDADLRSCDSRRALVPATLSHVGPTFGTLGGYAAECEPSQADPEFASGDVDRTGKLTVLSSPQAFPGSTTYPELGLSVVLIGALVFALHKLMVPGLLSLYSRLAAPRLLDQRVRADIVELVRNEPGLLLNRIAHRLEVGQGALRHHVRLLLAAGILAEFRSGRHRSLFEGPQTPRDAAAVVLLRQEGPRRLYDAVRCSPGAPLGVLADRAETSLSAASKNARRLVEAGLVRRDDVAYPSRWYPEDTPRVGTTRRPPTA